MDKKVDDTRNVTERLDKLEKDIEEIKNLFKEVLTRLDTFLREDY